MHYFKKLDYLTYENRTPGTAGNMHARLFSPIISGSYFNFGPRGTGKTSWLRAQFPDVPYFDLLKDDVLFDLSREAFDKMKLEEFK